MNPQAFTTPEEKSNAKLIAIAIIMTAIVTTLLVVGFFYLEEKQQVHDAEVFFNGTKYGQIVLINEIQTNGVIPYFNSTGHLSTVSFQTLCTQLNNTGGK